MRVSEINNVIPSSRRKTSLEVFMKIGLTKMEALEIIDRLDIRNHNNHKYSSQLLHVNERPVAMLKNLKTQDYEK